MLGITGFFRLLRPTTQADTKPDGNDSKLKNRANITCAASYESMLGAPPCSGLVSLHHRMITCLKKIVVEATGQVSAIRDRLRTDLALRLRRHRVALLRR